MRGFTFVELLISLMLSTLIGCMAVTCFMTIKQITIQQRNIASRFYTKVSFSTLMESALHKAGHLGCVHLRSHLTYLNSPEVVQNYLGPSAIEVLNLHDTPNLTALHSMKERLVPDMAILWIKSLDKSFKLKEPWNLGKNIYILGAPLWQAGDVVVIADCSRVMLAKVEKRLSNNQLNQSYSGFQIEPLDVNLSHVFLEGTTVGLLRSEYYYLATSSRQDNLGHDVVSLYKTLLGHPSQELLEGFHGWKVIYEEGQQFNEYVHMSVELSPWHLSSSTVSLKNASSYQFEQTWYMKSWA